MKNKDKENLVKAGIASAIPESILAFEAYDAINAPARKRQEQEDKVADVKTTYQEKKDSYNNLKAKHPTGLSKVETPEDFAKKKAKEIVKPGILGPNVRRQQQVEKEIENE